jgi:AraC-like DNA-binding protein
MEKYKLILPSDVYITSAQWREIISDRKNGISHPEITSIRLTGNNFIDLFALLIEGGAGIEAKKIAKAMGVPPIFLTPAIAAMTGLSAHRWASDYVLMSACDKLRYRNDISGLASRLGFGSLSAFSHFFYRHTHKYPQDWR